jgi:hypothetical protein
VVGFAERDRGIALIFGECVAVNPKPIKDIHIVHAEHIARESATVFREPYRGASFHAQHLNLRI